MWESLRTFVSRVWSGTRRSRLDRDFTEELETHAALLADEHQRRGLPIGEAGRRASVDLGGVTQLRESNRDQRGLPLVDRLLQDVRFALRMFAKSPGFTVFAGAALALGIGATTAVSSVANTVLIRPLPYRDASRLVMIWEDDTSFGFPQNNGSPFAFEQWKEGNRVLGGMAALTRDSFDLIGQGQPQYLLADTVTSNFFDVLGVKPMAGRTFTEADGQPGAPLTVALSYGLWTQAFAGDRSVIGRDVTLSGSKYTVIGVMPRGFRFIDPIDVWVPSQWTAAFIQDHMNEHSLTMVGRLRAGESLDHARAGMSALGRQLSDAHIWEGSPVLVPLREQLAGDSSRAVVVLLGAVAFLLLIACANVANLLLARGSARTREMAVRLAIGASRRRIIEQMLVESVLLSLGAGGVGLWLGTAATTVLTRLIPAQFPSAEAGGIDTTVLIVSAAVSIATGVLFGILPALRSSQVHLAVTLRDSSPQAGAAGKRLRAALVVAEIAIAVILLAGASLMIRSFEKLTNQDPGFHADHVLTVQTELPWPKYEDAARRRAFYRGVLDRIERLPGVVAAGYTTYLPLANSGGGALVTVEHLPFNPDHVLIANVRVVTPGYFRAVGMTVREGRLLNSSDAPHSQLAAVVNEAMGRAYWPGQDPIGRRFKPGTPTSTRSWYTVVGVVADMRQGGMDVPVRPEAYFAVEQVDFFPPMSLAVRTAGDPLAMTSSVQRAVWAVDREQPVAWVMTLEHLVDKNVSTTRIQALLFGGFGALGLVLAALGIYGVLSFAVSERVREIGVRMALGASPADVLWMIAAHGVKLFVAGMAIGLSAALALSHLMTHLLFGVTPSDPLSYVIVIVVLLTVTLLACCLPARRATAIDPLRALRWE
ncbi:MAG: ADOP family duplicated permease [Vicinamibacterales bacterium]